MEDNVTTNSKGGYKNIIKVPVFQHIVQKVYWHPKNTKILRTI